MYALGSVCQGDYVCCSLGVNCLHTKVTQLGYVTAMKCYSDTNTVSLRDAAYGSLRSALSKSPIDSPIL